MRCHIARQGTLYRDRASAHWIQGWQSTAQSTCFIDVLLTGLGPRTCIQLFLIIVCPTCRGDGAFSPSGKHSSLVINLIQLHDYFISFWESPRVGTFIHRRMSRPYCVELNQIMIPTTNYVCSIVFKTACCVFPSSILLLFLVSCLIIIS